MTSHAQLLTYLRTQQRATEALEKQRRRRMARLSAEPIYKGEKRRHVVGRIMDLLRDWRASPFEYEATCHYGLREELCGLGHPWWKADQEAGGIVAEALRAIGVTRPSWEQGQREYTTAEENCNWCGGEMPEEAREGNRKHRFCSDVCARSALLHRETRDSVSSLRVKWSAKRLIAKTRTTERKCLECDGLFNPPTERSTQVFCSMVCRGVHKRSIPEKACMGCGEMFRGQGKYCTKECYSATGVTTSFLKVCGWCNEGFEAKSQKAKYCCKTHQQWAYRGVPKKSNVIYLTAEIFDGWFQKAA